MRPFMVLLGTVFLSLQLVASSRADVAFENLNNYSGNNSTLSTFTVNYQVSSNVGSGLGLTNIRLFSSTQFEDQNVVWSLAVTPGGTLGNTGPLSVTGVLISAGLYAYDFNLSALTGYAQSTGNTYTLSATGLDTGYQLTTVNSITPYSPYQSVSNPLSEYFRFQVSSVPEPGTMALGVIALATGGVGTWWRRRKAVSSSES